MKPGGPSHWWIGGVAAIVAVGLRLVSFAPGFSLRKLLAYDDGAYFAGAQMLIEGHLPYRTFPFVQPPGVLLLGTPFALLGHLWGGDVGMSALRLAMIGLAAVTCALVADLLRPYGVLAAATGSLLFAVHPVIVFTGSTFFLEPFLTFAVVWTFWMLRRDPPGLRRYVLIGAVLGVACTVKLWAGVDIALFAAFLGVTRGRRRLLAWLGGVVGAIVVVCLPFFVLAPGAMWHQLVTVQLGRTMTSSLDGRLRPLAAFDGLPGVDLQPASVQVQVLAGLGFLVALAPLIVQVVRRRPPSRWTDPAWWSIFAAVETSVIITAPSFYAHYWMWPAGALALGFGRAIGYLDRSWSRVPVLGCVAVLVVGLAFASHRSRPTGPAVGPPPVSDLRAFVAGHECTYFGRVEVQGLVADRSIPMYAPCRRWPDPVGAELSIGSSSGDDPFVLRFTDQSWQRALRAQLQSADSVVLCGASYLRPFDAVTDRLFNRRFEQVGRSANGVVSCSLWETADRLSA